MSSKRIWPRSLRPGARIACDVDAKTRSTWSRVLRVAEANKATSIQAFVKERGGINQVAAMFWEVANSAK